MKKDRIKFNSVSYRQGFIEVIGGIHDGCVNIETTQIHPDRDITNIDLELSSLRDEDFIANTEVELSLAEAESLVQQLQAAIKLVKDKGRA
tara:strand:+ start:37 stop:309 length:273 start_codon:yes stop_codon:yes gene_type:complete